MLPPEGPFLVIFDCGVWLEKVVLADNFGGKCPFPRFLQFSALHSINMYALLIALLNVEDFM